MDHELKHYWKAVTLRFRLVQDRLQCEQISGDIEALTGYAEPELMAGQPGFDDLFHPHDQDVRAQIFSHVQPTEPQTLIYRILTREGQVKILGSECEKLPGCQSHETLILISLQLQTPASFKVGNDTLLSNFAAMADNTDDYIYFKDRHHVFTGASQSLTRLVGGIRHWSELIGKTDYDIFPREYADMYFSLEKVILNGSVPVVHETQPTLDVHGNKGWVDNRKYPIKDRAGNIVGLFGVARDITERVRLENAARHFEAIVQSSDDAIISKSLEGVITSWNEGAEAIFGYTEQEMVGTPILRLLPPGRQDEERVILARLQAGEKVDHFETVRLTKHGSLVDVSVTISPVHDSLGKVVGASKIARDITAQKLAQARLQTAANVFTYSSEGIVITDAHSTILQVNDAFTQITGYSREEVVGQKPQLFRSSRQGPELYLGIQAALLESGHWHGEVWSRRKDGEAHAGLLTVSAVRDLQGQVTGYVALFSDITSLRKQQEKLERIAHYDTLTGLPNRLLLSDRLQQAMIQSQRNVNTLAVVYLDLDGFKAINDQHGHDVGDDLLVAVSHRMKEALREGDTLARMGGDEFVAVLVGLDQPQDCETVLNRLLHAAASQVRLGSSELQVSASIGVTLFPQDAVEADQLLRHADQAMYQAKLAGKNRFQMFDVHLEAAVKVRSEGVEDVRRALARQEFVLHYQPKVNMRTGELTGAEALIRWQHPTRGLLPPGAFLPATEDHAVGVALGEWVINTALEQIAQWHAIGLRIPVSVNVGARQLQDENFVARLGELLGQHPEVQPGFLELEVLETRALEDITHVSRIMHACREIGVRFALDDFGTGYSSLTYLKRLPAATLKVDQSFVRDMLDDPDDLAIVQGVVGLAAAFRRSVVAEGVETVAHGELLLALGCEHAQGYGIAKPMPAATLPGWRATWRPDAAWTAWQGRMATTDDLALAFAEVEYRHWLHAIDTYLAGGHSQVPRMSQDDDHLGQWLETADPGRCQAHPAFATVAKLHAQLYATARALIAEHERAALANPKLALAGLHAQRDELITQLRCLLQDLETP